MAAPGILQEKFQVDYPQATDDLEAGWVMPSAARTKKGLNQHRGRTPLPPGEDIRAQADTDQNAFPMTMGGESDESHDWNPESLRYGFKRLPMRGTDDEYSNAHVDAFYDEMTVEGETGFTERNNVLDRM
jgi:hypothetical protein